MISSEETEHYLDIFMLNRKYSSPGQYVLLSGKFHLCDIWEKGRELRTKGKFLMRIFTFLEASEIKLAIKMMNIFIKSVGKRGRYEMIGVIQTKQINTYIY